MASSDMQGFLGTRNAVRAKRASETVVAWAESCIQVLLGNESSSQPASGQGDPLEHVVTFTLDGETGEATISTWDGQAALYDLVDAFKDAIVDAGGTILSG